MKIVENVNKRIIEFTKAIGQFDAIYRLMFSDRSEAIRATAHIVSLFNCPRYVVSEVVFNSPIEIEFMIHSLGNTECTKMNAISLTRNFDYMIVLEDKTTLCLQDLTSESLRKVLHEMTVGMWDVSPIDSDEDFQLIPFSNL